MVVLTGVYSRFYLRNDAKLRSKTIRITANYTPDDMPTYDYECPKCSHTFEAFQSITAEPLTKCPQKGCRGRIKRLIGTGGGLLFKGSGFYITDYRSDSYKQGEKAAKKDSSPKVESKSGEGKAESKSSPTESTTGKSN